MTSILKVDNIRDSSDNQAISISNGVVTFANDVIPTDNVSDLGTSSSRYKDLFLSGGVYLGGTGSANYLDDYEEGTWTPVDGSGAGLTFTVADATYTKVGRIVTCHAQVNFPTNTNGLTAQISGLPFTNITGSGGNYGAFTVYTNTSGVNWLNGSGAVGTIAHDFSGFGVSNATVSNKQFRLVWVYATN